MRLYELSEQYEILEHMLYDGETDEQVIQDTMEAVFGEIEEKVESYAIIITGMKADIEALESEEARLHARRTSLENRQKTLKITLMESMKAMGKNKIKTTLFTISVTRNGGQEPLVIDGDIDDIPDRFLIPQPPKVNRDAVRALLMDHQVEWAHLEPRGEHLGIR